MPRVKRWIPAALLCSVVLVQRANVYGRGLTPWMGAGFSMFTTTDDPFSRHLRCLALDADGNEIFRSAMDPARTPSEALFFPTPGRVSPLADVPAPLCGAPPEIAGRVARVRLETWTLEFTRDTSTVEPRLVTSFEREVTWKR